MPAFFVCEYEMSSACKNTSLLNRKLQSRLYWVGSGRVGLGQSADGLGWIGSHKKLWTHGQLSASVSWGLGRSNSAECIADITALCRWWAVTVAREAVIRVAAVWPSLPLSEPLQAH